MDTRPRVNCEAIGCRQPSLVLMPDGSNICEFHYGKWWSANYWRVSGAKAQGTQRQCADRIRILLANPKKRSRAEWIEHWKGILANPKTPYARECALEALKNFGVSVEREPGSDDELMALGEEVADRISA